MEISRWRRTTYAPEQAPALIGKMNPFKLPMLGPTLQSVVFGNWVVNCCTLPPLLEKCPGR